MKKILFIVVLFYTSCAPNPKIDKLDGFFFESDTDSLVFKQNLRGYKFSNGQIEVYGTAFYDSTFRKSYTIEEDILFLVDEKTKKKNKLFDIIKMSDKELKVIYPNTDNTIRLRKQVIDHSYAGNDSLKSLILNSNYCLIDCINFSTLLTSKKNVYIYEKENNIGYSEGKISLKYYQSIRELAALINNYNLSEYTNSKIDYNFAITIINSSNEINELYIPHYAKKYPLLNALLSRLLLLEKYAEIKPLKNMTSQIWNDDRFRFLDINYENNQIPLSYNLNFLFKTYLALGKQSDCKLKNEYHLNFSHGEYVMNTQIDQDEPMNFIPVDTVSKIKTDGSCYKLNFKNGRSLSIELKEYESLIVEQLFE